MEINYRFRIKPGKINEYVAWVKKMETEQPEPAPGWSYKETYLVVQGFGDYDAEARWELDDYAALGAGQGSAQSEKAMMEFFTEFFDDRFPMQTTLMKTTNDVFVPEGY